MLLKICSNVIAFLVSKTRNQICYNYSSPCIKFSSDQ